MLQCPTCGRQFAADVTSCPDDGALLRADVTVSAAVAADPLVGRVLDEKYRLDERMGEGGMGTVYRATHLLIERPVAVKVLNSRLVTDESARERFRREARAAGRLQHTNAVAVTDFGETKDGLVYLVMELLEGRPLREVVAREAPLDAARAVSIMLQVAAAVAAAHEAGVIHRDLKPGNIFVVQRPSAPHIVKVLDFGIAKIAEDADGNPTDTLTGAGVMIGTPRYMSPEQCDGVELTPASDVYSLGVILYEMLAGQTPFSGATPLALALKHSSEEPPRPSEFAPAIPPALEAVVLHALEKAPHNRPADAGQFRRELYEVAERLGLEHAEGFSSPTIETLRDAGTETPSGRLVIDLERLRRQRATSTLPSAQDTAEEEGARTSGRRDAPPPAPPRAGAATGRPGHGVGRRERFVRDRFRVRVPARRGEGQREWSSYLRQPNVAWLALAAVLFVGGGFLLYRAFSGGERAGANARGPGGGADEAVGRTLSAADTTPRARPTAEPRSAAEFYERGAYYFSSRNFDGAVRDFRRALELQPDFPEAHNRLGRVLMMQGKLPEAIEEFRKAVEQQRGGYPAAQYNLGFALQARGQYDEAIKAYTEAIAGRGGTYPDAHFQIGISHFNRARYAEAADALRKAIEQNGGRDPEAQNALGAALTLSDDFAGAETAFRAAIDGRGGDYADAHFNLGMHYAQNGRTADAIRELEVFLMQETNEKKRRDGEAALRELRRKLQREGGEAR